MRGPPSPFEALYFVERAVQPGGSRALGGGCGAAGKGDPTREPVEGPAAAGDSRHVGGTQEMAETERARRLRRYEERLRDLRGFL
ncbi:MAG TPA: hypothetical protein VEI06_05405 [Gemmatimonadaceae bacterium]|nr:hypothetical protein [Gemmatimonadaceae bacterium]